MGAAFLLVAGLLTSPADAGRRGDRVEVYVNGVRADSLPEATLEGVTVRFDADGNIWIDAPNHLVEVDDGAPAAQRPVPAGRYWLVTDDQGSSGQVVDVVVNGTLVRKVRSGEPQTILDLQPFLRSGPNTVILNAIPTRRGGGGPLRVYVGPGDNDAGTVVLEQTDIVLSRDAQDADAGLSRTFTLNVR